MNIKIECNKEITIFTLFDIIKYVYKLTEYKVYYATISLLLFIMTLV